MNEIMSYINDIIIEVNIIPRKTNAFANSQTNSV